MKGGESYEVATAREVFAETGLTVSICRMLYIEDLINPKFWVVMLWFAA